MSSKKIITSLAVGVVIGVLIAPQKGSKTRRKLARAFHNVSDCVQDIVDNVKGVVSKAKDSIDELTEEGHDPESTPDWKY